MTWSTSEIEFDKLPLLLRRIDYLNIWEFKSQFTQLIRVKHFLEKVTDRGLPENYYNQSLADFDHYMCTCMEKSDSGIIFLVETFGGTRNYYFYTLPDHDISPLIERAKIDFNVKLKIVKKADADWNFLNTYPVRLFPT